MIQGLVRWSLPLASAALLFAADALFAKRYPGQVLQKGTTAPYTIRADSSTVFDLHESRAAEVREARQAYVPIYDKDNAVLYRAQTAILNAALERPLDTWGWANHEEVAGDAGPFGDDGRTHEERADDGGLRRLDVTSSATLADAVDAGLTAPPSSVTRAYQEEVEHAAELEALVQGAFRLLEPLYKRGVVADTEYPQEKRTVRLFAADRYTLRRVSELHRFSELRPLLERGAKQFFFKTEPRVRAEVIDFVLQRLPANVTYAQENERFIADMSQVTGLKIVLIHRGDVLAGRGQTVDTRAHYALRAGSASNRETSWTERRLGRFGLVASVLFMLALAGEALCPSAFRSLRTLLFVHAATLLFYLVAKVVLVQWPVRPAILPYVAVSLVAAAVLGRAAAILVAIAVASSLAFALHFDLTGIVVGAAGGVTAALVVRPRRRMATLAAGVLVGLAQALAFEACRAASGEPQQARALWAAGQAFIGGLLSGPVALFALPFAQRWLGQASRGSLEVLGDFDHPMYRLLRERVPDVFSHTIRVANLADAAAKATGADRLLTRVGALVHDIGKLELPEGPPDLRGAHSGRACAGEAHVRAGVALAREARWPREVVSFIEQHHGTLALAAGAAEEEPVASNPDEDDRLPRTVEVAIVMLANRVEWATRRTSGGTPAQLVERHVLELVRLGQLVRCPITPAKLEQVRRAMVAYLEHRSG